MQKKDVEVNFAFLLLHTEEYEEGELIKILPTTRITGIVENEGMQIKCKLKSR